MLTEFSNTIPVLYVLRIWQKDYYLLAYAE